MNFQLIVAIWRTRMLNECSCERVPWNIYAGAVNCTNSIPLKSFIFIIFFTKIGQNILQHGRNNLVTALDKSGGCNIKASTLQLLIKTSTLEINKRIDHICKGNHPHTFQTFFFTVMLFIFQP